MACDVNFLEPKTVVNFPAKGRRQAQKQLRSHRPPTKRADPESVRVPRARSRPRHRWQRGWSECSRDRTASSEHVRASTDRTPTRPPLL